MDNREALVQRRHSRAGRSVQYHEVKDLFRQTYRILVERIDKVMQIFRQSYKETFALYTRNRKKVYIPVTTTQFRGHVTSLAAPKGQRQVSAEIVETGATAISNGEGVFIFRPLPPGNYTLRLAGAGFEPIVLEDMTVRLGHLNRVAIQLHSAQVA